MTDTSLILPDEELTLIEPDKQDQHAMSMVEQVTRGEVDMQVATAKRWPRSLARYEKVSLATACRTAEIAASCYYTIPRGGKKIEGPSVRLAEILATCYGNLRTTARIVEIGETALVTEGICWDLETNNANALQVRSRITDSRGRRYNEDMINVTAAASVSKSRRNAILATLGRAHADFVVAHAKKVAGGDRGSLDDARKGMLKWFESKGVEARRVFELLECEGVADITTDDIATLKGLKVAIEEQRTSLDELFPPEATDGVHRFGFGKKQPTEPTAAATDETPPKK